MRHSIISAAVGLTIAIAAAVPAWPQDEKPLELSDNPPDRYVVVKGDTLWGISKRFLKSPWRWPDLWGMNKDAVRNPHLIYPGNVLVLDLSGATPRLHMEGEGPGGVVGASLAPSSMANLARRSSALVTSSCCNRVISRTIRSATAWAASRSVAVSTG